MQLIYLLFHLVLFLAPINCLQQHGLFYVKADSAARED
jgi:hypothetical protein